MNAPSAYPLAWPDGWPRTPLSNRQDSKYRFRRSGSSGTFWTFASARDSLIQELDRLHAHLPVLSSNFELRLDGLPSQKNGRPHDEGIAIYFQLRGQPRVMACDLHLRAEENMRSITLAIQAMRQLERHGGGLMMERAFQGFAALPAPDNSPGHVHDWRVELDLAPDADLAAAEASYRRLARKHHPDHGGDPAKMARLNFAREAARRELKP